MHKKLEDAETRIVFNTAVLYIKMAVTMGVSFYTVRLLLNTLGVEDYGITILVSGLVTLFSFLNSAMAISTQRYLSFYQGTNDHVMQKKVFKNSLILHIGIGGAVVLVLMILMPFLFDDFLNIPISRIESAKILYYCMVISVFFTIMSVPFRASLNAHENMVWDSIFVIKLALLKLLMVVSLTCVVEKNRLIYYGLFILILSILSIILYAIYCMKNYQECTVKDFKVDSKLIKELGRFAGWNLYTNLCYVLNTQGFNVIFNLFLGPSVNAAYGVAFQVNSQVKDLSQSLLRAINPQIMKSEGMNNRERTIRMSMAASKFGFFLVAIVAIPCIFVMSDLLGVWLGVIPEYTAIFCSFFLIATLINQLTIGIASAIQAVGDVKYFQILVGTIALFSLPTSYFVLQNGYSASSVFMVIIVVEIITGMLKIYLLNKICNVPVIEYYKSIVVKMITPALISGLFIYYGFILFAPTYEVFFAFTISFIIYPITFYLIGLNQSERVVVKKLIRKLSNKSKDIKEI